MNARAVAAWSCAAIVIALATSNPVYKAAVVVAAFAVLAAAAGLGRMRRLIVGVTLLALIDILLNFVSAHLGRTVLFALPDAIPALGGPYTVEALAFGGSAALTIAAAVLAAAALSLLLAPHEVMDALPGMLSRSGTALSASLNLVPTITRSFTDVLEAQRLRGWRPRGARSWAEVVVPVVLTAAEGSIQLAESMEARGFGSGIRTRYAPAALDLGDWIVVATSIAAVVGFALARALGWAAEWYAYPSLESPIVDARVIVFCALLFVPVVLWRKRG
ncbi:MAG TPA: energy-coupling factor transporter transmembrane component T [Candidatus Dormibacteraeota bacterium]